MLSELECIERYGINPLNIGMLPCDWWVVVELDDEDKMVRADINSLCISTLDGKDIDISTELYTNYIGTVQDLEDEVYRYYYFNPVDCFSKYNNNSTRCKECNVAVECYESANQWG